MRSTAGIDLLTEQFLELYDELRINHRVLSAEEELRATADSLSRLAKHIQIAAPIESRR